MSVRQLRSLLLAALLGSLLASSVTAAVFERDLVPGSGDGLLTFDDVNNREWLDLPETRLEDIPFVPDPAISALENRYQVVLSLLEPGEIYAGFQVANRDDILALAESAGIDLSTCDFSTSLSSCDFLADDIDAAAQLVDLLGVTAFSSGGQSTLGLFDEVDPLADVRFTALFGFDPLSAGLRFFSENSQDRPAKFTGVYLYRTAVPEPSGILVAMLGIAIVSGGRQLEAINRIP